MAKIALETSHLFDNSERIMSDDIIESTMCTWELDNFMDRVEQTEGGIFTSIHESGSFSHKTKFQMKLNVLGINKDLLELYYLTNKAMFIRTTLYLKMKTRQLRMVAELDWKNVYSNTWQYVTGMMTSDIKGNPTDYIFLGGKLVLCLKVEVMDSLKFPSVRDTLQFNFRQLMESGESSDVDIYSNDGKVFKAHKLILTCRSPVFAAMFKHDMQEGSTNIIKMDDYDGDMVNQLLSYMYTDTCPKVFDNAEDLLQAADKYQLLGLKNLCEQAIFENVTMETAVRILLLAEMYNAEYLRKLVLKYIKEGQVKDLLKSGEWRDIDSCDLLKDLLEQLLI